mmetsp:Transcript_133065/g.384914  ORF Transcript_133065/g.384914 Transcript_133065/m.384914 type:complete len:280 (-) Transcript_133065:8-847(-)
MVAPRNPSARRASSQALAGRRNSRRFGPRLRGPGARGPSASGAGDVGFATWASRPCASSWKSGAATCGRVSLPSCARCETSGGSATSSPRSSARARHGAMSPRRRRRRCRDRPRRQSLQECNAPHCCRRCHRSRCRCPRAAWSTIPPRSSSRKWCSHRPTPTQSSSTGPSRAHEQARSASRWGRYPIALGCRTPGRGRRGHREGRPQPRTRFRQAQGGNMCRTAHHPSVRRSPRSTSLMRGDGREENSMGELTVVATSADAGGRTELGAKRRWERRCRC